MLTRTHTLAGGYTDTNGTVHKEVELMPLGGREEELLTQADAACSARLVSEVLSRCVTRIGDVTPVSREVAADLLVGDRFDLMLQLRSATFGDEVEGKVICPWPECGCEVGVSFKISDINLDEYPDGGPYFAMDLSSDALAGCRVPPDTPEVVFRLPTGRDQEAVSDVLSTNEAQALTQLLKRCVAKVGGNTATAGIVEGLGARARLEIEAKIDSLSPDLELSVAVACPDCNRQFDAPFDLQKFFFGELRTTQDLLYREVHYLAFHYHWSEEEIMSLRRDRRRKYIEVLADEIEQINSAHH